MWPHSRPPQSCQSTVPAPDGVDVVVPPPSEPFEPAVVVGPLGGAVVEEVLPACCPLALQPAAITATATATVAARRRRAERRGGRGSGDRSVIGLSLRRGVGARSRRLG